MNQFYMSSEDYAERVRTLLRSGQRSDFLHAALELRLGVEARLREYADANVHLRRKVKLGWNLVELTKGLGPTFHSVKDVMQLAFYEPEGLDPLIVVRYTPVPSALTKITLKLGNFLHFGEKAERWNDEAHWESLRKLLNEGSRLLNLASSGELLGPALRSPSNEMSMQGRFPPDWRLPERLARLGSEVRVHVSYRTIADELASGRYEP